MAVSGIDSLLYRDQFSTPAMREPDALTSPERPGSQNHMRIPSPAPRTLLLVVSPDSFSPSSFSSLSARLASAGACLLLSVSRAASTTCCCAW